MRRGVVRRAKLYYLRNLTGKAARIREKTLMFIKGCRWQPFIFAKI